MSLCDLDPVLVAASPRRYLIQHVNPRVGRGRGDPLTKDPTVVRRENLPSLYAGKGKGDIRYAKDCPRYSFSSLKRKGRNKES
jgi:hypothetical protein